MPKKILVVDDEINITKILESRLSASGYEVISANDGQQGLERAQKESPDLIILDLMLPRMDGYKVCGLLKSDVRFNKIPIILFTARAEDSDKKMGQELGADAYITKPFEPQILLTRIKELIGA